MGKFQKLFFIFAVLPLLLGAKGMDREVPLWVEGTYGLTSSKVFIRDNRTYVPLRMVSQLLGYEVLWQERGKMVTVRGDDRELVLAPGSKTATVNGIPRLLDAPATMVNSRTFVPLRFVAETFGKKVDYLASSSLVLVGDNFQEDLYYPVLYLKDGDNGLFEAPWKANLKSRALYQGAAPLVTFDSLEEMIAVQKSVLNALIEEKAFQ